MKLIHPEHHRLCEQGPSEPAAVPQQLPKHLAEKSTSPRNSGEFEAERSENGRVHGASSCSLTSRTGSSESMSIPRKSSGASRGDWLHVSNSECLPLIISKAVCVVCCAELWAVAVSGASRPSAGLLASKWAVHSQWPAACS